MTKKRARTVTGMPLHAGVEEIHEALLRGGVRELLVTDRFTQLLGDQGLAEAWGTCQEWCGAGRREPRQGPVDPADVDDVFGCFLSLLHVHDDYAVEPFLDAVLAELGLA